MEESKDLQTTYKIFRTFIYVSLVLEFFEYAIDPNVIDHWGGILVDIHDRIKLMDVYQDGHLLHSKVMTLLMYARHEHCLTGGSPEQALIAGIA